MSQTKPIEEGDFVQWMHTSSRGRSVSFSTRKGTIKKIVGSQAEIKMRNGTLVVKNLSKITRWGDPSPVNKVFEGLCSAAASKS